MSSADITLMARHDFIIDAIAQDATLRRSDCAVLAALVGYTNKITGLAWPSLDTLSRRCGLSVSSAKRAVQRLAARRYLSITSGEGHATNDYRIDFSHRPVVSTVTPHAPDCGVSRDTTNPTVVSSVHDCGVNRDTVVVSSVTPKLIYELGDNPSSENEGRAGQRGGAKPAPPSADNRVEDAPSATWQDRHPRFWLAYPFRADVSATEAMLDKLASAGAPMDAILDGAARYARYCAGNPKMRMNPLKWLEGQRWRDDWTTPTKPTGKAKGSDKVDSTPMREDGDQGEDMDVSEGPANLQPHLAMLVPRCGTDVMCDAFWPEDIEAQPYAANIAHVMRGACELEAAMEEDEFLDPIAPWPPQKASDFTDWLYRRLQDSEGSKPGMASYGPEAFRAAKDDLIIRLVTGTRVSRLEAPNPWLVPVAHVIGDMDMLPEGGHYLDAWQRDREAQHAKRHAAAAALSQARAALAA